MRRSTKSNANQQLEEIATGPQAELTKLLLAWQGGDSDAQNELMRAVYDELRIIAGRQLANEHRPDAVLQTTALVHEAFLRFDVSKIDWQNRRQFFGMASRVMRQFLVDSARRSKAEKRGAGALQVTLDGVISDAAQAVDLLALDEALHQLEAYGRRKIQVVELRLLAGLTIDETAKVLDVSVATIERDLAFGKAWLRRALDTEKTSRSSTVASP